MQKRYLVFPTIVAIVLSLLNMNTIAAQPGPNKSLPPIEVCYGQSTGTIEFVCKDENYHYRAIDCDDVNQDTGECHSGECTMTNGKDCAGIRGAYEDSSSNEPQCVPCTTIFAPVYD